MKQENARRLFLQKCFSTALTITGAGLLLYGCGEQKKEVQQNDTKPPADPCSDYSGLTDTDLKARQSMGYVEVSPDKHKQCSNCNLYLPPLQDKPCGQCQLFKGPVKPGGHCTYWAPQAKKAS
ncbi:MAG: high-potential iron-sulfur protein [Agriterribacter sp.]